MKDDFPEELAEAVYKESIDTVQRVLDSLKGKTEQAPGQLQMLIAAIAARFLDFGLYSSQQQWGREGAERWLQMALGLAESDLSRTAKCSVKLKAEWPRAGMLRNTGPSAGPRT